MMDLTKKTVSKAGRRAAETGTNVGRSHMIARRTLELAPVNSKSDDGLFALVVMLLATLTVLAGLVNYMLDQLIQMMS